MHREPRHVLSHRPYAVNLDTLTWGLHNTPTWGRITAVWYRRRNGHTAACIGYLSDQQTTHTSDPHLFLARLTDGRHGGHCDGRWDGTRYWGAQEPDLIEQHLALLRPMLDSYPTPPAGFDGWWRF